MKIIPYGRQHISEKDVKVVKKTLKDRLITGGNTVINFENKISDYLKCKYVSSCNSGTSALYLALLSIDIKKNDKIIMPSVNFVSSYNICITLGAKVYLADVDEYTGQMTPNTLNQCIKKYRLEKLRQLYMYNGGHPIDAEKFLYFKKNLIVILLKTHVMRWDQVIYIKKNLLRLEAVNILIFQHFLFIPLRQ